MLGRFVLRGHLQTSAVDQELISNQVGSPDLFVTKANAYLVAHGHGPGAPPSGPGVAGSSSVSGGGQYPGSRVPQFYLQVLADSFAQDLPSARRGQEQLGALAGGFMSAGRRNARNLASTIL